MKKLVLVSSLFCCCFILSAQTGYQIRVSMKPFSASKIYLAYYYGKMKAIADSTVLDAAGNGMFSGKKQLPGGIYFLVSPRKEILFEILIDKPQPFSIRADTSNLPFSVSFSGSPVNSQFQSYTTFATRTGKLIAATNTELASAKKASDSAVITAKIKKLDASLQVYRD